MPGLSGASPYVIFEPGINAVPVAGDEAAQPTAQSNSAAMAEYARADI